MSEIGLNVMKCLSNAKEDGRKAVDELKELGLPCGIIGRIVERKEPLITVKG